MFIKGDRVCVGVGGGGGGGAFQIIQFSAPLWCDTALLTYNILSAQFSFQMIRYITVI